MANDSAIYTDPKRRHDFILLYDVTDGNPNGDPDAGNLPRVDPETMEGLVTDVCLKRKIRNFVDLHSAQNGGGNSIYVQDKGIALNTLHDRAYQDEKIKPLGNKQPAADIRKVRERMCSTYYDVRMFGAVMTTGVNCGQVRGPMQLTFSRSIDQVIPLDVGITRVAITKPEDAKVVANEDEAEGRGKRTEMGRKAILPYGLYLARGFFSPAFASQTGVTREDLEIFWDALMNMWDLDRSASRGMMACRGLYVFSHEKPLGNAPAHKLFERIQVPKVGPERVPRSFMDYKVTVDEANMPEGVTLTRLMD